MSSEKIKGYWWFIRNSIFVIIYALLAIPGYEIVAKIHLNEPVHLFTPIDYMIPPIMGWALIYVFIFYPFVLYTIAYFTYIKPERSLRFFSSLFLIYAISFITYIIFPVEMIRPNLNPNAPDFFTRVMAKYYASDPPVNCFPSLHAANSSIAAYHLSNEEPKGKYVFWSIAFLVMVSTLFVRQHVIVDEIAGFAVAIFAGVLSDKFIKLEEIGSKYMVFRVALAVTLATLVALFMLISYV